MRLNRHTLPILMAPLALALAISPSAAAEWWWFDGKQERFPISTLKKEVEPSLDGLTLSTKAGGTIGPCKNLKVQGEIYNKFGGMGEGQLTKTVGSPEKCQTSLPECTLKKLEPSSGTPNWTLTLTAAKQVVISNFGITVEIAGKCGGVGLPEEFTVTGTIEGTWIDFEEGGGSEVAFDAFEVKVGEIPLFVGGALGFGTEVRAKTEPTGFTPAHSPAEVKAEALAPVVLTREEGVTIECESSTLKGTAEEDDTTVALTPSFEACDMEGLPATITPNGCQYLLHLEAVFVEGETYRYLAPTDLKCPAEQELDIDVYLSGSAHEAETFFCRFTFDEASNQSLESVELWNMGDTSNADKGWIYSELDVQGISSERAPGSSFFCGSATDNTGTMEAIYEIVGEVEAIPGPIGVGVFP